MGALTGAALVTLMAWNGILSVMVQLSLPVGKAPTKSTEDLTKTVERQRSTVLSHPLGDRFAGQGHVLQRPVSNQAMLRLLGQTGRSLTANQQGEPNGQPVDRLRPLSPFTAVNGYSAIQTKLPIGRADDPLEHEADDVADKIMRMPDPTAAACLDGGGPKSTRPEGALLTKTMQGTETAAGEAPDTVHQALGSHGQPLDATTRAFFEPRFRRNFGDVRVHTDANAAASARAVNALAYTVGRDVVFREEQYRPGTPEGKRLLAHELTHVEQQAGMRPPGAVAPMVQRDPPPPATAQPAAPPPVTQQLYADACASIATKPGVNPALLRILNQGKVSQTVKGVYTAASKQQVSIPAAPGASGGPTSAPAVKISFDLEISPAVAQLASGAFAQFVDDPSTQTSFTGAAATGQGITRLLKIVTKAPAAGATAAATLGEALVHEGTHMLLQVDSLLSSIGDPGLAAGVTGTQTAFDKYVKASASSALRGPLAASLVAEVNRVFTPAGANASAVSGKAANDAVDTVIGRLLEERFAVDRELAAYPRTVSNVLLADAYLWDLLADALSKKPWPKGPTAQALVTATAAFLDDVAAKLNPPAPAASQTSPPPAGSGTPKKGP